MKATDLTGKKFGHLLVLKRAAVSYRGWSVEKAFSTPVLSRR